MRQYCPFEGIYQHEEKIKQIETQKWCLFPGNSKFRGITRNEKRKQKMVLKNIFECCNLKLSD